MLIDAYATRKKCVFKNLLKVTRQEIVFVSLQSAFHIRGSETEKILSPNRLIDGGTYKSLFVAERQTRVARCLWSRSVEELRNECGASQEASAVS